MCLKYHCILSYLHLLQWRHEFLNKLMIIYNITILMIFSNAHLQKLISPTLWKSSLVNVAAANLFASQQRKEKEKKKLIALSHRC